MEFHAWAKIRVYDLDDPDMDIMRLREKEATRRLRDAMHDAEDDFSQLDLRRTSNNLIVFLAHGLRYEPILNLFRWIAAELPFSYGLLYVNDDVDQKRGADDSNEFRVWRVALGKCEELADPFLSPHITTAKPL